ncbi:J domain-containing protein [Streptomyces sp. enrichment culture]|uniref:J domain-containing protein n=1 Tax=Streptomyces sp. enrichment culture TaxID=1795815 RepID=UPI003F55DFAA
MSRADEPDLYAVLGVPADAPRGEIARAYRRQALVHHPDRGGDAETFRRLHRAYDTLSDPVRRAAYDRRRQAPSRTAPRPAPTPPPPAADPFTWEPGAGPSTGTRPGEDSRVYAVSFPAQDPGSSWRRDDRFAWWRPADESPPRRRRRRR